MKHITTILLLLASSVYAVGQEIKEVGSYELELYDKEYSISSTSPFDDDNFNIYITAESSDKIYTKCKLILNQKTYPKFMEFLDSAASKYENWSMLADSNGINKLSKRMNIDGPLVESAWYASKWYFGRASMSAYALFNNGYKNLVFTSGEVGSYENKYIDYDGFQIAFSSVEEINEFRNQISITRIKALIDEEDIFK